MYRIVTYSDARDQVRALPDRALKFYAEALAVLKLVPRNGRPYNPDRPDGMREFLFGADREGSVVYILLEHQQEVHITLVQWLDLSTDA